MGRHYSGRPGAKGPTDADVLPTPERRNHGPVERLERPIGDNSGRPARPYRAIGFMTAQLDPLSAFDLSRPRAGRHSSFRSGEEPGFRIDNAREVVWRAVLAVGGLGSAGGSCLWHVLGWERSLKEWALEQGWNGRRVSQEAASGIFIAALGALEAHFGGAKK